MASELAIDGLVANHDEANSGSSLISVLIFVVAV